MEIDRRLFCKLFVYSSVSLLTGCLKKLQLDLHCADYFAGGQGFEFFAGSGGNSGYPGTVIPLDLGAIRRMGPWAG